MNISVEEMLEDGSRFRYTILLGTAADIQNGSKFLAAELMEYKAKESRDYIMVLPKATQMSNEEKFIMRGSFQEIFVDTDYKFVFEMSLTKLFRMRSEAWLKAETVKETLRLQ